MWKEWLFYHILFEYNFYLVIQTPIFIDIVS